TRIISYLVNLRSLEINIEPRFIRWNGLNNLENLSLPILKILKVQEFSSEILANLIENTKGHLSEISMIYCGTGVDIKRLIPAIYRNCPNLRYLKLSLYNENITEFENLLINCQFLNGLVFEILDEIDEERGGDEFGWDKLFKILIKSSPISRVG